MFTLLTIAMWVLAYSLVGSGFYKSVAYIRKFDYIRGSHSDVKDKFRHRVNDQEESRRINGERYIRGYSSGHSFVAALLWPVIGLPSLLWHLSEVDWTSQERKLVKKILNAPRGSHDQLEKSLESMRLARMARLEKEISLLEGSK